jgi:hypothetical protein
MVMAMSHRAPVSRTRRLAQVMVGLAQLTDLVKKAMFQGANSVTVMDHNLAKLRAALGCS